jgi:hypothetical protein
LLLVQSTAPHIEGYLAMANFKRTKGKRNVRCTLCTTYRWMGNGRDRIPARTVSAKAAAEQQVREFGGQEK